MQSERAKHDVDKLWAELNQHNSNKYTKTTFEKIWHGFSSDVVRATVPDAIRKQHAPPLGNPETVPDSQHHLSEPKAVIVETFAKQWASVDQLTQALQSPDVSVRRAALHDVQVWPSAGQEPSKTKMQSDAAKLGKAVLRRFDDRSEACRELAVTAFSQLVQMAPDGVLALLPYALPVLEERLHMDQAHNPCEPSEEVRLLLVQLLHLLLELAGSAVVAYASEVWSMLSSALADSFHEVALVGCQVAQRLAASLGLRLGSISKDMVAALLPLTTHKRHQVRIHAIYAIQDVMHQGAHEMILEMVAWRDPNMVPIKAFYGDDIKTNFCGKLAADHHPQVRLAFVGMIGNWLLSLRERRDHEPRLLPYLLSGLCDENPGVVGAAVELLDQLGQLYEKEHDTELADIVRFEAAAQGQAVAPVMQQIAQGLIVYGSDAGTSSCTEAGTVQPSESRCCQGVVNNTDGSGAVFRLPGPFKHRPRLGSRLLVRNNLGASVAAMCSELSCWQSETRAMSARLLLVNLLLAEEGAAHHAQVLVPALCSCVRDVEAGPVIQDCAAVMGCFCEFPVLLGLLEARLSDLGGEPRRQADVLVILAAVVRSAGSIRGLAGHFERILALLTHEHVVTSQDSSLKCASLAVMQQLAVPHNLHQLLKEESLATALQCRPASACMRKYLSSGTAQAVQPHGSSGLLPHFVHLLLQLRQVEFTSSETARQGVAQRQLLLHVDGLLTVIAPAAGLSSAHELLGTDEAQMGSCLRLEGY